MIREMAFLKFISPALFSAAMKLLAFLIGVMVAIFVTGLIIAQYERPAPVAPGKAMTNNQPRDHFRSKEVLRNWRP